jgi:hypothetical protein
VVRRRCLGRRSPRPPHPLEETPVIDPEMTLVVKMKKVGPWIDVNLHGAMILGPRP